MMDPVRDDGGPQDLAHRQRAREERHRAIEVFRCQLANPFDRLAVDSFVSGREGFHRSRPLNVGRSPVEIELPAVDAEAHVRV